jgi:zinc finger protein 830
VKQWDAHLLTKQHRTSLAREKALQAKAAKRAAPESSSGSSAKRARLDAQTGSATGNGARDEAEDEEEDDGRPAGLPAGFFSAGNRPSTANDSDEADEGEGTSSAQGRSAAGPPAQATVSQSKPEPTGDAELDDFLASLEDDTPANLDVSQTATAALAAGTSGTPAVIQKKKGYQSSSTLDTPGVASYVAAPVLLNQATDDAEGGDEPAEPEETEEERRERLAREEREEIMGRLEEEERAQ